MNSEIIDTKSPKHIYNKKMDLIKEELGEKNKNSKESDFNNIVISEDNNLRTTVDTGGKSRERGIEFNILSETEKKQEFEEIYKVLEIIENSLKIKEVKIEVQDFKESKRAKAFAYLSDKKTKRKFLVAQIISSYEKIFYLLEVQRENKSLSTLLLFDNRLIIKWRDLEKIFAGVVEKSGKWNNSALEVLINKGLRIERLRHSNKKNIVEKAQNILNKILNIYKD